MGICLDTCHVWDGGYDIVHDLDGVLNDFDHIIGLERLKAIHLNDSLNDCGSHKDRHARIGEGENWHGGSCPYNKTSGFCGKCPFYPRKPQMTILDGQKRSMF